MNFKTPLIDLNGKVVLITGASGGQGVTHARLMKSLGAKLVLTDIDADAVAKLAESIGEGTISMQHDVSSSADWQALADKISEVHGHLDVLVNNAGIVSKLPLLEADEGIIRKIIEINLVGCILGMKIMQPLMVDRDASIVNISSSAALAGNENLVAYTASKWGVLGATRSVAKEYGKFGIRVNAICPGAVDTAMTSDDTREGKGFITRIPIPRVGRPEEISNMVAFLASDASSYCTGHEFTVDGGQAA